MACAAKANEEKDGGCRVSLLSDFCSLLVLKLFSRFFELTSPAPLAFGSIAIVSIYLLRDGWGMTSILTTLATFFLTLKVLVFAISNAFLISSYLSVSLLHTVVVAC